MSIEFKRTDKEYILLVNHPELVKRAEELGYQGVSLFTGREFDDADLAYILKVRKPVVSIAFNIENKNELDGMKIDTFDSTDIQWVQFELARREMPEGGTVETVEDAVKRFPAVEKLETWLKHTKMINETDYTGRCGNCHSFMEESDRYCRCCGTKKRKGKFLPFKNESYGVYGPPIECRYKCRGCGHMWVTGLRETADYCVQCGKKKVMLEAKRSLDFFEIYGINLEDFFPKE